MRRADVKPWLRKHEVYLRCYGLLLLLASPVILPVASIVHSRTEIRQYYKECFDALRGYDDA